MDVIVLTDGQVWEPAETINFVKEKWKMSEGMIRFFSFPNFPNIKYDPTFYKSSRAHREVAYVTTMSTAQE